MSVTDDSKEGTGVAKTAVRDSEVCGPAEARRGRTRRRLIKAGLLGIPLVITVRARPAKAQSNDYQYGYGGP